MAEKILVKGKAQNRTALGIVHAYMTINPKTTLAGLRAAFPFSLCPDCGVKELLLPADEAETHNTKMSLYFTKPDEVITLADGSKVALAQVWSKTSLDRLMAQAGGYDIKGEVDKSVSAAGGFEMTYLNGWSPKTKKGCPGVLIAIVMLAAATGTARQ